jgi:hypothetical protein
MLKRRHNPPYGGHTPPLDAGKYQGPPVASGPGATPVGVSPALLVEPEGASPTVDRHRTLDRAGQRPGPALPLPTHDLAPPKLTALPPPSAEVWALHKRISELNDAIDAARAASDAQQQALTAARAERDKWRGTAAHVEAESHKRQRIWWGVGGLAAGAAVHFLTKS